MTIRPATIRPLFLLIVMALLAFQPTLADAKRGARQVKSASAAPTAKAHVKAKSNAGQPSRISRAA